MGIYLPNMEMPTKCSECLFAKLSPTGESLICNYMLSIVSWDERPFDCPLVEVPTPHGRLIDADAFEKENAYFWNRDFINPKYEDTLADLVNAAPTIIEAEE